MSGRITIVGLGPGDPSLRTMGAQQAFDRAEKIILRTGIHPGIDDLLADPRVSTCDDLYESLSDFDMVYEAVASRVIESASQADLVFAVPGHPLFGEQSVNRLIESSAGLNISLEVLPAVSALDAISSTLRLDPLSGEIQIVDAASLDSIWNEEPFSGGQLAIDPTRPCLVGQIYSKHMASHTKLVLARIYPEDHKVILVRSSGVLDDESLVECRLFEVDHFPVDHLTTLFVPPLKRLETFRTAEALQRVVAHLRSPDGCPWDRKQDHASLRNAIIEEAHEVVDAIDAGDADQLAEELGDLFLLIAMHAQIAHEDGSFSLEDIYEQITRKLIRRHPHVFGDVEATSPEEVISTWEGVKQAEREAKGSAPIESIDPFDRLPKSMPTLTRVASVMRKKSTAPKSSIGNNRELADALYDAVEALVAAGYDPEVELLGVAKSRLSPNLSDAVSNPSKLSVGGTFERGG